jgi:DNA-binding CsgD family transcriptional regulator
VGAPERPSIIGRQRELDQIQAFVVGPNAALTLAGSPGIGKTTLWEAGLRIAPEAGYRVMASRASEAETGLPFAALADLVDDVDVEVFDRLPAPQRRALDVALRRTDWEGEPQERFASAAGFLGVLKALSAEQALLIAVDDVQWLDQSSAEAIAFTGRRLAGPRVRFLLSRRTGRVSDLEKAVAPAGLTAVEVSPLTIGAVGELLADRLEFVPRHRLLRQIFETAHGNPMLALEIARLVADAGSPGVGEELPIPDSEDDAFGPRVRALDPSVRRALVAVALDSTLSRSELEAVSGQEAVRTAISDGLLVAERNRVRPAHPMITAVARRAAGSDDLMDMRRHLAQVVRDPLTRARHLAMTASQPDLQLAAMVARAAQMALSTGATHDAEDLAMHALRLTDQGDPEWSERVLTLGRCLGVNRDFDGARELLMEHLPRLRPPVKRAEARIMLSEGVDCGNEPEHLERALEDAADDARIRATVLARQSAWHSVVNLQDIEAAEQLALAARSAAADLPMDELPEVTYALGWARILRGASLDGLVDAAAPQPVGAALYDYSVMRLRGIQDAFRGRIAEAARRFELQVIQSNERGDMWLVTNSQVQLAELALRAGRIADAEQWTNEIEVTFLEPAIHRLRALIATVRGDPADARQWLDRFNAHDDPVTLTGVGWERIEVARAGALLQLYEGEYAAAAAGLRTLHEHLRARKIDEFGAFPVLPDLVEALVLCGDCATARVVTEELAEAPYLNDSPWAGASLQRMNATTSLGLAYDDESLEQLLTAALAYAQTGLEFDAARCLLFAGRTERRHNRRSKARAHLEEASRRFSAIGCSGWAELARTESARISGRRGTEGGVLTASEQRVAELAASGLTNKEIAEQLFVSTYTIEAHLSHAYAKLGVRSRTQLAQRLSTASADG